MDIYKTREQEIHHFGSYCAVVWNLKDKPKKVLDKDSGEIYTVPVAVRDGKPYILFVTVRYDKDRDEFYTSDDNPVVGGLSAGESRKLAEELLLAAEYLESQS